MSLTIGSRKGPASEMNLTPLIDVLLVLIIIFMVITPNHSSGEQAEIPKATRTDTPADPNPIVVQVLHEDGEGSLPSLRVNGLKVSWQELTPTLTKVLASRANRVAFVKGDDSVEFEYVAQAMDIARSAGADRVGLMTPSH